MQANKTWHKSKLEYFRCYNCEFIEKLIGLIPPTDSFENKLGGPGCVVHIDETMLNFKCKSHRSRSPENRTDSLCIVEYNGNIKRVFAQKIVNKGQNALILIICRQVVNGFIIWTGKHKGYINLRFFNYIHDAVRHKYEFLNKNTDTITQAIKSLNIELKKLN